MSSKEDRQMQYEAQKDEYAKYLMSISQEVDSQSSIRNILNHYGISVNRNGQCICPFHQDTKPSMSAERNDKYVHCFVDNKTWYAVNFITDYEATVNGNELGFYNRIKKAIDIQGLNIDLLSFRDYFKLGERTIPKEEARDTRLKNIMRDATEVAKQCLKGEERFAAQGREYLFSRKLSQKTIDNFNIGIEFNNNMLRTLTNDKGYSTQQLVDVGLLKLDVDTGETKNTFRNRVLVPICNEFGKPVGFGGRVLDDRKPKYLNTGETEIFYKSNILFNYHQAKTFARNNEIVLVEGYFDVISAYEMGMKNVVGLMGVALTEQHIELIKQLNCDVVLCLDNPAIDKAGKNAMIKAIPQLLESGLNVSIYDSSKLSNKLKDFGDFLENGKTPEDIFKTKVTGFQFLMKHYYFENKEISVENVSMVYKQLQRDGLIKDSSDELKYKEYVSENSSITKTEIDDIIHPKEIKVEINSGNRIEKAMQMRFAKLIKNEILRIATKNDNKILIDFIEQNKLKDADIFVGMNDDKYCSEDGRTLNVERFINEYVINLDEYKKNSNSKDSNDLTQVFSEMLNNVWTYDELKNPIRVWLTDEQKSIVLDQYMKSFPEEEARKEFEDYPELYTKLFIANEEDDYDKVSRPMSSVLKERWKLEQFNLGYMALVTYNDCFPANLTLEEKKKISSEYIALTRVKDPKNKNFGKPIYYFKSLVVFNNTNEKGRIILTKENFIEPKKEKVPDKPKDNLKNQVKNKSSSETEKDKLKAQRQTISIVIELVNNEYLKSSRGIYILTPNNKNKAIFLENGYFKFNGDNIEYNINHQDSISLYNLEIAGNFKTRKYEARLEKNEFLKNYKNMYYNKQNTEINNDERNNL